MKKKKTWRLIGTGFDFDNNIICDVVCEEIGKIKIVNIVNTEESREVLSNIINS